MEIKFTSIFLLFLLSPSHASDVVFTCDFNVRSVLDNTGYTCNLINIIGNDIYTDNVAINGQHLEGFNRFDVVNLKVLAKFSSMYSQFSWIFPNLKVIYVYNSDVEKIEANLFAGSQNSIEIFNIEGCNMRQIKPYAFNGLNHLKSLQIWKCGINSLNDLSFYGLGNLEDLNLFDNLLTSIPPNTLQSLTNLKHFSASFNRITTLSGSLFANNPQIETIVLFNNCIEFVGRSFINGLNNLQYLMMGSNVCVNENNFISEEGDLEKIERVLKNCFYDEVIKISETTRNARRPTTTDDSSEETTRSTTRLTTDDSSVETTRPTTDDSSEETTRSTTRLTTDDSSEETTRSTTRLTTDDSSEETTRSSTRLTTDDSSEETTRSTTRLTTDDSSEETTRSTTRITTDDSNEETTRITTRRSTTSSEDYGDD